MKRILVLGALILSGCGKSGQEAAPLTASGMLCRDNVSCKQWCGSQYLPGVIEVGFSDVTGTFYASCPSTADLKACPLASYSSCLPTIGCTIEPDSATAQAAVAADRAKNCLDLPESQVLP